jgi:hypothetical protein
MFNRLVQRKLATAVYKLMQSPSEFASESFGACFAKIIHSVEYNVWHYSDPTKYNAIFGAVETRVKNKCTAKKYRLKRKYESGKMKQVASKNAIRDFFDYFDFTGRICDDPSYGQCVDCLDEIPGYPDWAV